MPENLALTGIILAAGKGVRMKSSLPKVLHAIAGKTMLEHVIATLKSTPLQNFCVVLNDNLEPFRPFMAAHEDINICIQKVQNGTGGAVAACAPSFLGVQPCAYAPGELRAGEPLASTHVLICAGDCPALQADVLEDFIEDALAAEVGLSVLGIEVDEPRGYGRLLCDEANPKRLLRIIEDRDATPSERSLKLCNSGVMFAETSYLFSLLSKLAPANAQSEYYLTDCIELAQREGRAARVFRTSEWRSFLGVNTPEQLQDLAQYMKTHILS